MLAIRMQRTGRSGHAQFRVIVQDSRFHPTRGRVVAYLGSYDPHAKTTVLDKELAAKYLDSGAQPSDRVAKLMTKEGMKLPEWVKISPAKESKTKHPEKLRKNRPAEPETPAEVPAAEAEAPAEPAEAPAEQTDAAEPAAQEPSAEAETAPTEEAPAEPVEGAATDEPAADA